MFDHLTTEEELIRWIIFLSGAIVFVELGRFGVAVLALRTHAKIGALVQILAVGFGSTRGTFEADVPTATTMMAGYAIVWAVSRMSRSPRTLFTKALLEMPKWKKYHYVHAVLDESRAQSLRKFPRAQKTAADFKAAIDAFEDHESINVRMNAAVAHVDLGFLYRMMGLFQEASREMDAGLAAVAALDATSPSEKIWGALGLGQGGEQEVDRVSCRSLNLLDAMNRACSGSGKGLPPLLMAEIRADAGLRKSIADLMATAFFRRGELHHISGNYDAARRFYEPACAIFDRLENTQAAAEVRCVAKLLNDVTSGGQARPELSPLTTRAAKAQRGMK